MAKKGPDMQRVPEFNVGDLASPKAAMSVAISVVLRADEIPADSPDLIVFPEGISWDQIHFAAARHPHAAIVGGVDEGGRIRAALWHAGANRIDYARLGRMGGRKEAAFCRKRGQCTSLMTCASVCCSAWTLTLPYSVAPLLRESSRASTRGNFFVCRQIWDRIGLKEATSARILQACTSSSATIRTFTKSGARVLSLTRLAARSTSRKITSRSM